MSEEDCFLIEALLTVAEPCNDDASAFVITDENAVRLIRCALNQDFTPLYPQAGNSAVQSTSA
ncbi:hypothetical protein Q669_29690 [Labrenzia sp. C1B10]|nr:hypothetical protein Q669_29690 [Labrenzia sp. C1B10]ERS05810.1 hypothetical protein Q675_29255 [Labrenzia sp. C1B70]